MRALWEATCRDYRPPQDWQWASWSRAREGSRDYDTKPFCDWHITAAAQRDANLTGWEEVTTASCEEMNHVHCDTEGNVVELGLSGTHGDTQAQHTHTRTHKHRQGSAGRASRRRIRRTAAAGEGTFVHHAHT